MADIETLGIIDDLQSLICDKLQVVSYKWLSRNYLVSSNDAKRLLQDYVEKHGTGLAVVYNLSGWLKNNPSTYHVRLVSKPKLEEAKQDFEGNCSVQIYSVQSCIPKDPASLWNAEFVQAEELFKQPVAVDNCLRDNRFCGVLNSFVKRNGGGGPPVSIAAHQVKSGGSGLAKSSSARNSGNDGQSEEKKFQPSIPTAGPRSSSMTKEVKSESYAHESHAAGKTAPEKEKYHQSATDQKKAQPDQNSNRSSATLANMWGRAKPKQDSTMAETKNAATNSAASAEDQIKINEVSPCGSSDDDGQQVNTKRTSNLEGNRKRRVVFDFSDEEDEVGDAVNLASPDLPSKQPAVVLKQDANIPMLENKTLYVAETTEDKPKIAKAKNEGNNYLSLTEPSRASNGKKSEDSCNSSKQIKDNDVSIDDKMANAAPRSPKRRKVLKTRIDERGREVTDVVWEDKETESKAASDTSKKTENSVKTEVNRFPATKKSPALGNNPQAGKGGNKKAGNKDPKQGNILSFFKKA